MIKLPVKIILIYFLLISVTFSEIIKKIEVSGNQRIPVETIEMFSSVSVNDDLSLDDLNIILKELYETNFFENVNLEFSNSVLKISVIENPIIENINFEGIKVKKIEKAIRKNLILKSRSSYNEFSLAKDKNNILSTLKTLGFYFPEIEILLEELEDNKVDLTYKIDVGRKTKIKKISFLGNKIFKDRKLRSVIVSEEFKFWKFITGRKYLNQDTIKLDERLLKNFYLS